MKFIEAVADYNGHPHIGNIVYINPDYIIKMDFMGETEDGYGICYEAHYVITVDLGNRTEDFHITLEIGDKLLKDGEIKI